MSNILVLTGSKRKNGNTDLLAKAFAKGAQQNNNVEIMSVADYNINPCTGCNACFNIKDSSSSWCCQHDDMDKIYDKIMTADVLVIASPVYFYGISASLKAVIDRFHTPKRSQLHIKKLALLLVGAANLPQLFDSILVQYKLILNFFNLENGGTVLVRGVKDVGDIQGNSALDDAYQLGTKIS